MVRKRSFIKSEPVEKPSDVDALSSFMDIGEDLEDEFSEEFSSDIESSYESSLESYYEQQRYPAERSPDDYYRHGPSSGLSSRV